jgi:hypothetical protein
MVARAALIGFDPAQAQPLISPIESSPPTLVGEIDPLPARSAGASMPAAAGVGLLLQFQAGC